MNQKELKSIYQSVFNTEAGKTIYNDLYRIANQGRIDMDAPSPYACVYRVAQQALLKRIINMIDREQLEYTNNLIERNLKDDRRN